ncbi:MAG: hypothetical protein P0116_14400 [Candidatus Nitrosocosmicus sp.]|nr:hypothetical protein [Candidatus Nitrosocosmicus sp.]
MPEEQIFSLLGITPLATKKGIKITNSLQEGNLSFRVDFPIALGNVISGSGTLALAGDTFEAKMTAPINLKGLGDGKVEFKYEKGIFTGKGMVSVILKEGKYKGDMLFDFNGESLSAEGKIGYNSDKFSGEVLLQLMDVNEANSLQEGKQDASVGVGSGPTSNAKDSSLASSSENKTKKINKYVIAGQGNLNFAFTDWLTGNANRCKSSR